MLVKKKRKSTWSSCHAIERCDFEQTCSFFVVELQGSKMLTVHIKHISVETINSINFLFESGMSASQAYLKINKKT